jgi:hypothetical protein
MQTNVIRTNLYTALVRLLRAKDIEDSERAVAVFGATHGGVEMFAVTVFDPAKKIVNDELVRITGRSHSSLADMWLLDERETLATIEAAR